MTRWSDFGIFRVAYGSNRSAIAAVEVRRDLGDQFGAAETASRGEVVSAIGRGVSFVTVYLRDGTYHRGEDVRVVTIEGQRFLRTDRNAIRADNLGALPEIRRSA